MIEQSHSIGVVLALNYCDVSYENVNNCQPAQLVKLILCHQGEIWNRIKVECSQNKWDGERPGYT